MNAIELLKADHQTVRKLLDDLTETTIRATRARPELVARIERELSAHTRIEEEIFYPAFRKAGGSEEAEMYHEAREEHRAVEKLVLPDLKRTDPASHEFSGRAKVLKELVEHHADEEEEEMFPDAEKLLSADQLTALGKQMAERKRALLEG